VALIISRVRTQTIPSSWPAGIYAYKGYAHATFSYPATDSSSFLFAKNASANGDLWITDASCTGEPFPGERSVTAIIPSGLELKASPNPFNATTAIRFELRVPSLVNLKVYDSNGGWWKRWWRVGAKQGTTRLHSMDRLWLREFTWRN
jgi:hypothetical protein